MRDQSSVALAPSSVVWPPDDTEESVLGTNLHQTAIRHLISAINEAAAVAVPEGAAVPWQAGGQMMLRGFRRWDGSDYTTLPDVFVYRKPWNDERGSLQLATDGPPVLIIEVLSKETYEADLDLERGKGYSYARARVAEYLALDPGHRYAPEGGVGWRLVRGVYQPWRREGDGRWASQELPLAFGLEGARAAVYAADGLRFLREGEVERALQERDRRLAEQERRLARETQERRRAEAEAEQERRRREAMARQEQALADELDRLRRRLEELERGS
jgi:hypothetical protein